MRPVTLALDGFRSYASDVEIDWTGRRLVGIVGPIGSGKSSILDAICFALYGKTPTEKANQRSLIHQRADVGKVEFVFDVGDERWKVVRALRRKGQSPHALYKIDLEHPDSGPLETVLGKGEVDARIEEVLGIDFDGFNRSVMLAQGRFSDFLKSGTTERDKVLKGVFGLDKVGTMETIAKRIRDAARRDLEEFGRRKADLDNVRALAERAKESLAAADERAKALAGVAGQIAAASASATEAATLISRSEERTTGLAALAKRMPDAGRSREILAANAALQEQADVAREELTHLAALFDRAKAERETLFKGVGGEADLALLRQQSARRGDAGASVERELQRKAAAAAELERSEASLLKAQSAAEGAVATAGEASAKALAAAEAVRSAEEAYHDGQHADMAASLRAELADGDPCPVCAQVVTALPKRTGKRTSLDSLRVVLETSRDELRKWSDSEKAALATAATAAEALTNAQRKCEEAALVLSSATEAHQAAIEVLDGIDESLQAALGESPIVRLAEVETALASCNAQLASLDGKLIKARQTLDAAQGGLEGAQADLRSLISTVSALAAQVGIEHQDISDAAATDSLLGAVRDAWVLAQQAALKKHESAVARLTDATQAKADAMESVGLAADDDFSQAVANADASVTAARTELEVRAQLLAESSDIDDRIAEREGVISLYEGLAKDLRPSAFLGYLLEEERAELARVSSDQFEQLSGGRYRFSDDGEFNIIDLNAAEQIRKSSSLSGGETFLASLALALALAEMVARGKGRLDAFFLDEGFGSLDAEHLDLAMAGIESLVAGHDDRLVVIVSHVPDMRDRIEDLLILDKDPATGSTVVVGG